MLGDTQLSVSGFGSRTPDDLAEPSLDSTVV